MNKGTHSRSFKSPVAHRSEIHSFRRTKPKPRSPSILMPPPVTNFHPSSADFIRSAHYREESAEYVTSMDAIVGLGEGSPFHDDRVEDVMHGGNNDEVRTDMSIIAEEFRHVLTRSTPSLDVGSLLSSMERLPFSPEAVDPASCTQKEENLLELVSPDSAAELQEMALRMTKAGYGEECRRAYCHIRFEALDYVLSVLRVEALTLEEIQKFAWNALDAKIRNWIRALRITAKVVIPSEKRLYDQIFSRSIASDQVAAEASFRELSRYITRQLLTFAEGVATYAAPSSEKIFRLLDMYDSLQEALSHLPSEEDDARRVLDVLGDSAKGILEEFEKAVRSDTSRKAVHGGDIHPMTRYVMNYIRLFADYSHLMDTLLNTGKIKSSETHNDSFGDSLMDSPTTPLGCKLRTVISSLESNLGEKSHVYEDVAMRSVFLMNNKLYILHKVESSELANVIGDSWMRRQRAKISQYATSYLRASWGRALSYLKDDPGILQAGTNASKAALKERFKKFNACLEDLYRLQTGWKVSNSQLREELQISVSKMVIPAYRSFVGRFGSRVQTVRYGGKYVKYAPEDLEKYLLDLFEGFPRVMHHYHMRRS